MNIVSYPKEYFNNRVPMLKQSKNKLNYKYAL